MIYTLYYRNYLKSCNYSCNYCPFAKLIPSEKMLHRDEKYLNKFVEFIRNSKADFKIFFAPKGEALIYDYYKEALIELSSFENVIEIVIQTNLSGELDWIKSANCNKLILWTTYHPSQIELNSFLEKVKKLIEFKVKFTVGAVGVIENFTEISDMSNALKEFKEAKPYFWINAYKDKKNYYSPEDIEFLNNIDNLFEINFKNYACNNRACNTGEFVFFLEWNGNIYRCFQDQIKLANIYSDGLVNNLSTHSCRKNSCNCFIGYSNLKDLDLNTVYKKSLLGRLP